MGGGEPVNYNFHYTRARARECAAGRGAGTRETRADRAHPHGPTGPHPTLIKPLPRPEVGTHPGGGGGAMQLKRCARRRRFFFFTLFCFLAAPAENKKTHTHTRPSRALPDGTRDGVAVLIFFSFTSPSRPAVYKKKGL